MTLGTPNTQQAHTGHRVGGPEARKCRVRGFQPVPTVLLLIGHPRSLVSRFLSR